MPWNVNSMRTFAGFLSSRMTGASMPGPMVILPVMRMDFTALSLSTPPRASTCLAIDLVHGLGSGGRGQEGSAEQPGEEGLSHHGDVLL